MQERRDDFAWPPADEDLVLLNPRCNSHNQPENTNRDILMDAIQRVLERIDEDNNITPVAGRRYEPVRREMDFRASDERGRVGSGTWMMTLAEEEDKFVERIAKKVEERIAIFLDNRIQKLLQELLIPLGQRNVEPKITEIVQPPHPNDEDKCDAIHSGAKRKAVSPLPEQVVYESTSIEVPKKTMNEDWSCTLCQVTATSKHGLDDHFKGKKHKVNEAAMRLKNERKNFDNRVSLNKKAKCDASYLCEAKQESVTPPEHVANEFASTGVAVVASEDWSCAICQFTATGQLAFDAHLQGTKHKSKEADLRLETVTKNQDNALLKKDEANQSENDMKGNSTSKTIEADKKSSKHGKKKTMILCEICNVRVTSEVAMELHRKGKNHLKLLKDVPIQNINQTAHTTIGVESCVTDDDAEVVGVETKDKDDKTFENGKDVECGCDNSLKVDDTADAVE